MKPSYLWLAVWVLAASSSAQAQLRFNSPTDLDGGTVGQAYFFQLVAAGGVAPYTFTLSPGPLPGALSLSPAGVISGTPSSSGDFTFTVRATDSAGQFTQKQFALNIVSTPLSLSGSVPPSLPAGIPVRINTSASGGTPPYQIVHVEGTLPEGIGFFPNEGTLRGTPVSIGSFAVALGVRDAKFREAFTTLTLNVVANTMPGFITPFAFLTQEADTPLAPGIAGFRPIRWSTTGSPPAGVTVTAGGRLRGWPTGTVSTSLDLGSLFTVTDALGTSPFISGSAIYSALTANTIITRSPLLTGVVNQPYSKQLQTAGTGSFTFVQTGGSLGGLTLSSSGLLSGTPTAAGTFSFSVAAGGPEKNYTLQIASTPFVWNPPTNLGTIPQGLAAEFRLSVPSIAQAVWLSGQIPRGMELTGTGDLVGTPLVAGNFSFTVEATSTDGQVLNRTFSLTVSAYAPPIINSNTMPNGVVGMRYSFADAPGCGNCNAGSHGYRWTLGSLSSLPPGLVVATSGEIYGIPTTAGTFTFTLQIFDPRDNFATRTYTVNIAPLVGEFTVTPPTLPAGQVGAPYTVAIGTSGGGTAPFTFAVQGTLPPGMSLSPAGLLSGTPTAPGTFNFAVSATDSLPANQGGPLATSQSYQLVISSPPPAITTLDPASRPAGSATFEIIVRGQNFISGSIVRWNGINLPTTFVSATELRAQVPATLLTQTGTAQVLVVIPTQPQQTTNSVSFQIVTPTGPSISGLNPSSVNAGGPGFTLTVDGGGFQQGSIVRFNTTDLATTFVSTTRLTAQIPQSLIATPTSALIVVRDPGGQTSPPATLQVTSTACLPYPAGLVPFATIAIVSQPDSRGDRLVVGSLSSAGIAARQSLPQPAFLNQIFCEVQIQLGPNDRFDTVYVPTAAERAGDFSAFGAPLPDPLNNNQPFPGNRIPASRFFGTFAWRIGPLRPAPEITTLNPSSTAVGGPNLTLTVNGTNFQNGAVVRLLNTDLQTTFVSATQLTATVTQALIANQGAFPVVVRNPDSQTSPPATFTVALVPPPQITTLDPASREATTQTFTLTVNGSNFQPGATLTFGAQSFPTTFVSTARLTANISDSTGAAGPRQVIVRNPGNLDSNPVTFTFTQLPLPTITGLNPNTVPAGSAAFLLTVSGTNFLAGAVIRFNGTDLATTFVSATQLTATVPGSLVTAGATVPVTVRNPNGEVSTTFNISGSPAPVLTSLSPNSIASGTEIFTLNLNGANFREGAVVLFNGTPLPTAFVNTAQLSAAVIASVLGAGGNASVTVRNPDNQTSNPVVFIVLRPAPLITSTNPLAVISNATELTLGVTGLNFAPGAQILFNGVSLSTTFVSATQLNAQVFPASLYSVPGRANINVRNPDGTMSPSFGFTIIGPLPQINSVSPSQAFTGGPAFQLQVNGSGFANLAQVRWNGIPLSTNVINANQLTASVTEDLLLASGSASISVRNPDGQTSNSQAITIAPALTPEIRTLTPASAAVNTAGLQMGVNGANFQTGSQVNWNGSPLATSFTSATQLTATVPAPLLTTQGVANVTVRNPGGRTSNAVLFLIGDALKIVSSAELPEGRVGTAYRFEFAAAGGARPYRFGRTGTDPLPAGLAIDPEGFLQGTPTAEGAFAFDLEVRDSASATDRQRVQLLIRSRELEITSVSPLPPATSGAPYSFQLQTNNAVPNPQWSVIEGDLPRGLELNPVTGLIFGVPAEPAEAGAAPVTATFGIQAGVPERNPATKPFLLTVRPPLDGSLRIVTPSPLPDGTQNRAYSRLISAVGGALPHTFLLTGGTLPAGVSFGTEGLLEGTPTQAGTFTFNVQVRDRNQQTATQQYQLRIGPEAGPRITSGPLLPIGGVSQTFVFILEAEGGRRPFTWSITSGSLPQGLTFDPILGRITGRAATAGVFTFTARVIDADRRIDNKAFQVPVTATGQPLQLLTAALPPGLLGRAYNAPLAAAGGLPPYRFAIRTGSLPAGVTLSANTISGTPGARGNFPLSIRLTDAVGFTVDRDFVITVGNDPVPPVRITGLGDTIAPASQATLAVELAENYPVDLTGRIDLDFAAAPAVPGVDPALQFSTGGRSAEFRIPAGQTRAVFSQPVLALQTGTVAGTITLRVSLSIGNQPVVPAGDPSRSVQIITTPPVIRSATVERSGTSGFTLVVTGHSVTREISEAVVVMTAAAGRQLEASRLVIPLNTAFQRWYTSAESLPFGTQFRLELPFTGDPAAIQSLTVTLRNSAGVSAESRVNF